MKHTYKLLASVMLFIAYTTANATGSTPDGKALGYTIKNCYSENSTQNYCSKKNQSSVQKILSMAKTMPKPNFDNDKKLIQFPTKNKDGAKITEIIIVDEKAKRINIFVKNALFEGKANTSPHVMTRADTNWFCLYEEGASFNSSEQEGNPVTYTPAYPEENLYSCSSLKNGRFHAIASIEGGLDNTTPYDDIPSYFE